MTTTHTHRNPSDPATIVFDGTRFVGATYTRSVNPNARVSQALADRLSGMTWREVALRNGYRSARVAEHNVGRYVAYLNNGRTPRTTTTGVPMSLRSFGVEIEFTRCTQAAAAAAISTALGGRDVRTAGYHSSTTYNEWRIEHDGSVSRNGRGGEAVSPIMRGPEGLAEIKLVVDAIKSVGGSVDRRTGIHVHIDAGDLTGEQIARLMAAYVDRQEAFDRMVSPSRRGGHYCAPMPQNEKVEHEIALKRDRRPYHYGTRYRTVNLMSLHRTGTVEFRQHQGSLNATKIGAWVKMLLALTASVVAVADEDLPFTAPELLEALTAHGLDRQAATSLTRRLAD